jgi:inosine/xanthosine triphosphatase
MNSFRVGVGSTNPIKVAAARAAVQEVLQFHGDEREVLAVGFEVESGVAVQPTSEAETRRGARNRAAAVVAQDSTLDLALGMEGGVLQDSEDGKLYSTVWICVLGKSPQGEQREGLACGGRIPVPARVAEGIKAGGEMGPLMDKILNRTNMKHSGGLFGVVTGGVVPREREYREIAVMALAQWWTGETELG